MRVALALWAVVSCLPLAAAGAVGLALGVYSYDSSATTEEAALYWTLTVVPVVAVGLGIFAASTGRFVRSSIALMTVVSVAAVAMAVSIFI